MAWYKRGGDGRLELAVRESNVYNTTPVTWMIHRSPRDKESQVATQSLQNQGFPSYRNLKTIWTLIEDPHVAAASLDRA